MKSLCNALPATLFYRSFAAANSLLRFLALLVLAAPMTAQADIHPYQRWADELGIDINVSYDGVRLMEMKEGSFEATERRAPGKMYTEMHLGGTTAAVILREDLKKSYVLMPSMGFYKEESLDGGIMQTSNGMEFSKIEEAGTEEIIGFPSTKYKTRFKDNDGKGAGIIWVTDSGIPIKFDMMYSSRGMKGQRITMVFTELNVRKQDPSHFELPDGLKPMGISSIASMMKMGGSDTSGSAGGSSSQVAKSASAEQEQCLQLEAERAAAQKAKEKKSGFGRIMGSIARTANRVTETTKDLLDGGATADDAEAIADKLGISEEAARACMEL